jgi:hypothetical protein
MKDASCVGMTNTIKQDIFSHSGSSSRDPAKTQKMMKFVVGHATNNCGKRARRKFEPLQVTIPATVQKQFP